jgi:hypothetical protein
VTNKADWQRRDPDRQWASSRTTPLAGANGLERHFNAAAAGPYDHAPKLDQYWTFVNQRSQAGMEDQHGLVTAEACAQSADLAAVLALQVKLWKSRCRYRYVSTANKQRGGDTAGQVL